MTYTLTQGSSVIRDGDGAFIPPDPDNADWRIYQEWVSAGNTPSPTPIPPATVPNEVSDRQFFQAAAILGLITEADALAMVATGVIPPNLLAAIGMLPEALQFSAKMKIIGARSFDRNDPFVNSLSIAMGQTPSQVDALFTLADTL